MCIRDRYGSAPVAQLQHYQKEVMAYTHGQGKLTCTWKDDEPCVDAEDEIKAIGYDIEPVSYTHLDVYKRQAW